MSYRFTVTRICRIVTPGVAPNHDGKPYTNKELPAGTIVAQDKAGDWFKYVGPHSEEACDDDWNTPPCKLFRDYWRYLCHDKDEAPHYAAFLASKMRDIHQK